MKRRQKKSIVTVLILLMICPLIGLWAQADDGPDLPALGRGIGKPMRIKTFQGGSFHGILRSVEDERIEIVTDDGQIILVDLASIASFLVIDTEITKETFFQDSASNRLIVMPTGFPMDTGEFHVADQEIIAVTMSYGLNEHASFWAGVSVPGFVFSGRYILSPAERFALSIGSFAGLAWLERPVTGALLPYLIASWGEPNNNFTAAVSPIVTFGFSKNTPFDLEGAVLALGGKMVLTSTTSLIFENWVMWLKRDIYDDSIDPVRREWDAVPRFIFPAVVFRIAGQRLSWDIGAILPIAIEDSVFVPFEDAGPEDEETGYYTNSNYRLGGLFDDILFPLPILSVTYRID